MSSQTTNLNLVKPSFGEPILVTDINGNMDILDGAYASIIAAILGCFPLGLGTEIPSSVTALSQIKQAGVYCKLSGFASAFSDLPANWGSCAAGNLICLPTAVSWRFRHILLPAANVSSAPVPYIWTRYMTGGNASNPENATWGKWVEFGGTVLSN